MTNLARSASAGRVRPTRPASGSRLGSRPVTPSSPSRCATASRPATAGRLASPVKVPSSNALATRLSVTLPEVARRSTMNLDLIKRNMKSMSPGGYPGGYPGVGGRGTVYQPRSKDALGQGGAKKVAQRANMVGGTEPEKKSLADEGEIAVEEVSTAPPPPPKVNPVTANAPMLASKHRLDVLEVKTVLIEFNKVRRNSDGGYNFQDFKKIFLAVFDIQDAMEEVIQKIYKETSMEKDASIDRFLEWYMLNMFSHTTLLTSTHEKANSEKMITKLAQEYGVSSSKLDNIKREFDKYDSDGSGLIDKEEFASMLKTLLKAKDSCDLSADRIKKFWMEIDHDGSGEVDFSEYANWYLKYFDPELTDASGSCNLIEAFYASFSPEHQRRRNMFKDGAFMRSRSKGAI